MITMRPARKMYRAAFGEQVPCPGCGGDEKRRKPRSPCCAKGAVIRYPASAPGLRAWVRVRFAPPSNPVGKLATICGAS